MSIDYAKFLPLLPLIAMVICGLLGCLRSPKARKLSALVVVLALAASFVMVLGLWQAVDQRNIASAALAATPTHGQLPASADSSGPALHAPPLSENVVHGLNWLHVAGFQANFAYYIDSLTIVMLLVITGVGLLIAIYASGYMSGDPGYFRFFAYMALFIFCMMNVVMADNLVLLYLGWEGVGLASYLLIGFYYHKPSAVAAAKKAFIVNRIGDLGFALGIFLTYTRFGTISMAEMLTAAQTSTPIAVNEWATAEFWIPLLLLCGAVGKSAQLPLYVWLPDAMEGPTPVSALIHAATMVTSGVYMIDRLMPIFHLSPSALPTVAVIGGCTALFGATIAITQTDIKRVWAFSTVSQLGYMFLGAGVLSSVGAIWHLMSHAFFKALLFLTAGSVMHAMAGQLDLRKMSGLGRKMPVTKWLMFCGAISLAGVPLTSGFFSKDTIIADALAKGLGDHKTLYVVLGCMALATALLTAFYAFRLWFRVFTGPLEYEMGEDHGHGHDAHDGHETEGHGHAAGEPHEVSWLMNGPLVILAIGSVALGALVKFTHWMDDMIRSSTAYTGGFQTHGHAELFGVDVHMLMYFVSGGIALLGIALAWYFHLINRPAADAVVRRFAGLHTFLYRKWYVDELYGALFVRPLRGLGHLCHIIDRLVIDGLVGLAGLLPRLAGLMVQPTQRGVLQGYGLGMVAGVAVILLLVLWNWKG